MGLIERRTHIMEQINSINDEQTLEMLEETIEYYTHTDHKDITDELSPKQLQELNSRMQEPAEKDTISEEEFRKIFARWGTK